jgi:hypothetical protein
MMTIIAAVKSRCRVAGRFIPNAGRNETLGRGSLYCESLIRGREQYKSCHSPIYALKNIGLYAPVEIWDASAF